MGLLRILFILSLVFFSFGEVARFQSRNGINLTLDSIGVFLLVLGWLIVGRKEGIRNNFLTKPLALFISIVFLSLIINAGLLTLPEFIISFLYLLRWIFYSLIAFIVISFNSSFKQKIPFVMIGAGSFIVLIGYIQYFLYPGLRNLIYLGWDEHLYRMFSSFLDPNFLGAFLVLNFLLILGLFLIQWKKNTKKLGMFGILGVLGVLNLIAVFLTYSRSALLMLFVGLFIFLLLLGKKKFIFVIFLILIFFVLVQSLTKRSEGTNLLRSVSSEARLGSSVNTLNIIKDNFLFGVGFNSFRYAQIRYGLLKGEEQELTHAGAGTDNSFLFILVTTGAFGFLAYIYLWIKILKYQFNIIRNSDFKYQKIFAVVIISSIGGIFINSLFINSLFYPFIMQWLWILIGLNSKESS